MKEQDILRNLVFNSLEEAASKLAKEKGIDSKNLKIRLEYSRNEKFGDYSTSFLIENKEFNKNEIKENAAFLINQLSENSLFSKVDFTMPGFINFKISKDFLIHYIESFVLTEKYPLVEHKNKIIFEFVSANPTGPLNIVSARAAATGDAICSLLEKIGHEVYREFYVNDYGNQFFLLGVSCLCRLRESRGEQVIYQNENEEYSIEEILEKNILPLEGYRGDYIKDLAISIFEEYKDIVILKFESKKFKELAEFYALRAVEKNLESQKKDLNKFGVKFDHFFSERHLHEADLVLKSLDSLKKAGDLIDEDGKKLFNSMKYGDDKNRVVLREDGRPTYLLADIAYHKNKMDRGFNRMINIWGPDHYGYIARLKGAVISMGYPEEAFKVLIAQQVNLLSKGEKVKMSKRLGKFQTMGDLLDYLGDSAKDIGRYFFIMRALESPLDFDLDLAVEESDKNPVFYIQYAHARIRSIFRELASEHYNVQELKNLQMTEERERLLFWIARFHEEIFDSAKNMEPHRMTNYLQNLCKTFTKFYIAKDNKLKEQAQGSKEGLAAICKATEICIKNGLSILGISAPEKMEKAQEI